MADKLATGKITGTLNHSYNTKKMMETSSKVERFDF
jgi:hypothetical protein